MDTIAQERIERERAAAKLAHTLPAGDYYASGTAVIDRNTGLSTECGGTHWDACLVMLAAPKGPTP